MLSVLLCFPGIYKLGKGAKYNKDACLKFSRFVQVRFHSNHTCGPHPSVLLPQRSLNRFLRRLFQRKERVLRRAALAGSPGIAESIQEMEAALRDSADFLTKMQQKSFVSRMLSSSSDADRLTELTKEIDSAMMNLQTELQISQAIAVGEISAGREQAKALETSAREEAANLNTMRERIEAKVGRDEETGAPRFVQLQQSDIAEIVRGLPFDAELLQTELTAHIEEVKQQNEQTHAMLEKAEVLASEHHAEVKNMLEEIQRSIALQPLASPVVAVQELEGQFTQQLQSSAFTSRLEQVPQEVRERMQHDAERAKQQFLRTMIQQSVQQRANGYYERQHADLDLLPDGAADGVTVSLEAVTDELRSRDEELAQLSEEQRMMVAQAEQQAAYETKMRVDSARQARVREQEQIRLAQEKAERERLESQVAEEQRLAQERKEEMQRLVAARQEEEEQIAQHQQELQLAKQQAAEAARQQAEEERQSAEAAEAARQQAEEERQATEAAEAAKQKAEEERQRREAEMAAEAQRLAAEAEEEEKRLAAEQKAMAAIEDAAEAAGLKIGNKVRAVLSGEVVLVEIVRYEQPAGKVIGRYPDGELRCVGDSVADAQRNVSAAVKTEWEAKSKGQQVYESHWNDGSGAKSEGTSSCIVLGTEGDDVQVFFQNCDVQTVPSSYVDGYNASQAAAAAEGTVVRSEAELVAALQKGDDVCLPPSVVIELG